MDRAEWLRQMRVKTEALYDYVSPQYWDIFGLYPNETHLKFLQMFLGLIDKGGMVLSAACGAGRYDGFLLESGHSVLGIDQSAGMLARARKRFPEVRYVKKSLQEMDFHEMFAGAICMDAMEHICPEDWPGILKGFQTSLKAGGVLYFTLEPADAGEVEAAYERARAGGLPVVPGELADEVDASYERVKALGGQDAPGELADVAVYHYYPSLAQVQDWIGQAGLTVEEVGEGSDYQHILARKQIIEQKS